jgi:hypothetical protein
MVRVMTAYTQQAVIITSPQNTAVTMMLALCAATALQPLVVTAVACKVRANAATQLLLIHAQIGPYAQLGPYASTHYKLLGSRT